MIRVNTVSESKVMKMLSFSLIVLVCLTQSICFAGDHAILLPAETIAYISVDSWKAAGGLWDNSQFVPLSDEERRYQDTDFADQFGVTLKTFGTFVSGRVTRAMISPKALDDGTTVIIAEVDPTAFNTWKQQSGLRQVKDNLYSLAFTDSEKKSKTAYFLILDDVIAISQQQQPLTAVVQLATSKDRSLAEENDFSAARTRLVTQPNDDNTVQFEWFYCPQFDAIEKEMVKGDARAKGMFHRHGLDAVTCLAGRLQQQKGSANGEMSVTILAKQPYRSTLGIFNPVENPAVSVPDWAFQLGRDGTVVQLDFVSATKNIAVLFDETFAEGIQGTYLDLLEDIKSEDGMGLDLGKELFAKLGPTLIYLGDEADQSWLVAIETSDAQGVADVVQLLLEDDPDVKRETLDGTNAPLWRMTGTKDTPDWYLLVSGRFLFCGSSPTTWGAATQGTRKSQEMDRWFNDVQALPDFGKSRKIVGLTWMKPDKDAIDAHSAANGMRGWFLGDYLQSKSWWDGQFRDLESMSSLMSAPTSSRNNSRGVTLQENAGGWTFYWKFQ